MQPSRSLTFVTGVALLGLGGALIVRAARTQTFDAHAPHPSVRYGTGTRIDTSLTIDRSADDLYAVWRDLERLPTILSHLTAVEIVDERRSRWEARTPQGIHASWEAEIIADEPGRRIAWRSVDGSVPNAGSVTFGAGRSHGTELRVEMEWAPPGGPLGQSFAHLFGGDPAVMVESDLRRFKSLMESGDVALNGGSVPP